jgi:hypothetical protein
VRTVPPNRPHKLRRRRYQRRYKGNPRKLHLNIRITPQLQFALMNAAAINHVTVSHYVEDVLWKALSKEAARKGAKLHERLRHVNALIEQVIAEGLAVTVAGQAGSVDIHTAGERQQRRNRISDKCEAALNEVYELAQSQALAQQNQTRAIFYAIFAQLAHVNETLLKGASDEEIMTEIQKLREEQERFEDATRQLEEEANGSSAKK